MGRQNSGEKNPIYRLTLIEHESHQRIWSVGFSKWAFIIGSVTAMVIFIALIYSIIAFTPVRNLIPGYPDASTKRAAVANVIKIDSLETMITKWNIYAENLNRVLNGDNTVKFDSIINASKVNILSDKSAEELRKQDSIMRASVAAAEKAAADKEKEMPIEGIHFFTPVKGVVSKDFVPSVHPGVDVTAPSGSVVSSILDGSVIFSDWDDEMGYIVIVQHEEDIISIYKYNLKLLKKAGETVKAGTPIALTGIKSGTDKIEGLHFELWHNGRPINPADYISF